MLCATLVVINSAISLQLHGVLSWSVKLDADTPVVD